MISYCGNVSMMVGGLDRIKLFAERFFSKDIFSLFWLDFFTEIDVQSG